MATTSEPKPGLGKTVKLAMHSMYGIRRRMRRQPFLFGHRLESNHVISLTSLVWLYPRFFTQKIVRTVGKVTIQL